GLNYGLATLAFPNAELVRLDLFKQTELFEFGDDCFACGETIEACEFSGIRRHLRGFVDHFDARKIVALAGFEIVQIVRGRDLHGPGAEPELSHFIEDDRDRAIGQRKLRGLARELRRARIFRIDGDCGIAQHRFRTRRRHYQTDIASVHGIADVPQAAVGFFGNRFEIGKRGLAPGTPVDHVLAAIDQTFFPQTHERLAHGARQAGIEREAEALPIDTVAGALHLLENATAVLFLPLPDARFEFLAAEVVLGETFFLDLTFHHDLSGDSGVIGPREPQRV